MCLICESAVIEKGCILNLPYVDTYLDVENEELSISYDAYSTDSSFYKTISFSFCPHCGSKLSTVLANVLEKIEKQNQKEAKKLLKQAEIEKERNRQKELVAIQEYSNLLTIALERGTYNVYELPDGSKYKAVGRTHLGHILALEGKPTPTKREIKRIAVYQKHIEQHEKVKVISDLYDINKNAMVGEKINCACCGLELSKKTYQQKFCSTICKDIYWNKKR
jgi:hypothetical protein